jgi:hypothetical protein
MHVDCRHRQIPLCVDEHPCEWRVGSQQIQQVHGMGLKDQSYPRESLGGLVVAYHKSHQDRQGYIKFPVASNEEGVRWPRISDSISVTRPLADEEGYIVSESLR